MLGDVLQALSGKGTDHLEKQKKKRLPASLSLMCGATVLLRNKHSVSIFRANVPTLSLPTKSFYMTNLQVELSW